MGELDMELSDRVDTEVQRLVDQGDFLNREQAYEELLQMGLATYSTESEEEEIADEQMFSDVVDEQRDPAMRDE